MKQSTLKTLCESKIEAYTQYNYVMEVQTTYNTNKRFVYVLRVELTL